MDFIKEFRDDENFRVSRIKLTYDNEEVQLNLSQQTDESWKMIKATKKLFKIHITLILSILSAYFCRLFSHVDTATLLHR